METDRSNRSTIRPSVRSLVSASVDLIDALENHSKLTFDEAMQISLAVHNMFVAAGMRSMLLTWDDEQHARLGGEPLDRLVDLLDGISALVEHPAQSEYVKPALEGMVFVARDIARAIQDGKGLPDSCLADVGDVPPVAQQALETMAPTPRALALLVQELGTIRDDLAGDHRALTVEHAIEIRRVLGEIDSLLPSLSTPQTSPTGRHALITGEVRS